MNPFVYDIAEYMANNIAGFSFVANGGNVKVGDLIRGENGVYLIAVGGDPADLYSAIQYDTIDFWVVDTDSSVAFSKIQSIYNLFHQAHHYNTDSYTVHFSHALVPVMDMDRDSESRKLLKISVRFIITVLIS